MLSFSQHFSPAQSRHLQALGQSRDGKDSLHIPLCHICSKTSRPISSATSPVLFQKAFEAHPDLLSDRKWTQSFLNPDAASVSPLWTTHLRNMCRNLTNKTKRKKEKGSVKRRNMSTWPYSPLRLRIPKDEAYPWLWNFLEKEQTSPTQLLCTADKT